MAPIVLLAGATATGKSSVALELARQCRGEIISVDSMQVYRGLDIGTAKPSAEQRSEVRHHLVDVVGLEHSFDVAQFVEQAKEAANDIIRRGHAAILCGGTGLYFQAFLEGVGDAPRADPKVRAELERKPVEELLRELEMADPVSFQRIHHADRRRLMRAIEVTRLTGKPFSEQRAHWTTRPDPSACSDGRGRWPFVVLERQPADLRNRIDARVEEMFQRGLVEETERLLGAGLAQNLTARQALGYRQVIEFLGGARSLEATVELVKLKTRHYAKRQSTWFRRQGQVSWIQVAPDEPVRKTAERLQTGPFVALSAA